MAVVRGTAPIGVSEMRVIKVIMLAAVALAACKPESSNAPVTGSIDKCVHKLYSQYNPKDLKQCVAVCIACQRGIVTTCSTACTLRGAQ